MIKSVIIVDDDLICRNNIKLFLEQFRETINIVGDVGTGEETLKLLTKYNPDILILDLNIPNKNGLKVLEQIEKNISITTKVIVISGEITMINHLNLIHSQNVINIFVKPFETSLLYRVIIDYFVKDEYAIVDEILHNFNFNFSSQSYRSLLLVINKLLYRPFVLNNAYKEIALEQNVNYYTIKWRIEKIIASMIRYTSQDILLKYIPYSKNPSPKIFISEILKICEKKIS